mgnify:CR=1 FL=1
MGNLEIRDLSIGDWIKVGGEPARVIQLGIVGRNKAKGLSGQIYGFLTSSEIEPIPITPEILEKNGFEKNSECCWRNSAIKCACHRYGTKYWDIRINGRNRAYRPTRISIDNILHTHELQNALRLAGLDEGIRL